MRTVRVVSLVVVVGLMLGVAAVGAEPPEIVVQVRSSTPGVEAGFSAGWLVRGGDSPLVTIEKTTPFSFRAPRGILTGIFRKSAGSPDIRFELSVSPGRQRCSGSGAAVLLNDWNGTCSVTEFWVRFPVILRPAHPPGPGRLPRDGRRPSRGVLDGVKLGESTRHEKTRGIGGGR